MKHWIKLSYLATAFTLTAMFYQVHVVQSQETPQHCPCFNKSQIIGMCGELIDGNIQLAEQRIKCYIGGSQQKIVFDHKDGQVTNQCFAVLDLDVGIEHNISFAVALDAEEHEACKEAMTEAFEVLNNQ